jgi:hypothetical protein
VPQAFHTLLFCTLHPLADSPSVTFRASAFSVCFQPRSFSSKARKRLPSRQSLTWLANDLSIVVFIIPTSLGFYAELTKCLTAFACDPCSYSGGSSLLTFIHEATKVVLPKRLTGEEASWGS